MRVDLPRAEEISSRLKKQRGVVSAQTKRSSNKRRRISKRAKVMAIFQIVVNSQPDIFRSSLFWAK